MAHYEPVDGIYRKVTKHYEPVDGVYRKVTKACYPVDGVYREYFSSGTPVGSLAVGDSVWLNVNGSLKEFLVVHQGNPDSAKYDATCDGTWLLMKDLYEKRAWGGTSNNYAKSSIHTYLNDTFLNLFDADIKAQLKTVKLPYVNGSGSSAVASGSSGLSTKIFLLSGYEVGWTKSTSQNFPVDGACLSYFGDTSSTDSKRIGYYDRVATYWGLRSPCTNSNLAFWVVDPNGGNYDFYYSNACGVRPAFILDSNTPIGRSGGINIIA
jgi:hypothetical protein